MKIRGLIYRLYKSPLFIFLKSFTSNIIVDKSTQLTLYTTLLTVFSLFKRSSVPFYSRAVAYNFTLAVFPGIIFLFTLIPFLADYLPVKGFTEDVVLQYLETALPHDMYDGVESTIRDIALEKKGDLLSFGFLFALIMATNGMVALMNAFNKIYKTTDTRGLITIRLIALFLTVMLSVVLISAVIIIIFGDSILILIARYGNYTERFIMLLHDIKILEIGVFALLFFVAISMIYYFAPAVKTRARFFSLGAFVASISMIFISLLFSFYINNFGTYNKIYGSIGTLIGFMIWVQSISFILIVGYVVNSGIDLARTKIISKKIDRTLAL